MGKNYFTEEQQDELRKNPYIEKISAKSITYTKEFKEKFEQEYRSGKLPSQILIDMGIDPRMLGRRRRDSLVTRIKLYELRPEGCEDTRKNNTGRPSTKDLTEAEKIKLLEQKIAYLSQENEFLKKIFKQTVSQAGNASKSISQIQTYQRNGRTKQESVKHQLAL